jgi:hypothetical protein
MIAFGPQVYLTPCTKSHSQQWFWNATDHQVTNAQQFFSLPQCLDAGAMPWVNPCSQAPASGMAMCDASLSFQERVSDLVGNLTLEGKAGLLGNSATAVPRLNIPVYQWWSEALHGGWVDLMLCVRCVSCVLCRPCVVLVSSLCRACVVRGPGARVAGPVRVRVVM